MNPLVRGSGWLLQSTFFSAAPNRLIDQNPRRPWPPRRSRRPEHARVQPPQGIQILNSAEYHKDPTVLTVVFTGEDHTMSNLLKHVIAPMPGVEFVGAGETHPLENRMILRIQTEGPQFPAADILMSGFKTINELFGGIESTFTAAYKKHSKSSSPTRKA
ncbi:RNA-pol-L-2 domain-containing protein [Aphelenchoides fujianensis]|nr:RNA-pol-L-2 domain-containing protein [Aphelenchoides fujianensis]